MSAMLWHILNMKRTQRPETEFAENWKKNREITSTELIFGGFQPFETTVCRAAATWRNCWIQNRIIGGDMQNIPWCLLHTTFLECVIKVSDWIIEGNKRIRNAHHVMEMKSWETAWFRTFVVDGHKERIQSFLFQITYWRNTDRKFLEDSY